MTGPSNKIAILGAMAAETELLVSKLDGGRRERSAGFDQWSGTLCGCECVIAQCGIGKVAAAASTQHLIDRWQPRAVLLAGLAGGLQDDMRAGDIVVGSAYIQHDIDASPIFPRWEAPGLGISRFPSDAALVETAVRAADAFVRRSATLFEGGHTPVVRSGLIATGDQFVTESEERVLHASLPDALCVDMEAAAAAQVCHVNGTSFLAVRVISDNADKDAAEHFHDFLTRRAPAYITGVLEELLTMLSKG